MPANRFYIDSDLIKDTIVELHDSEFSHLIHVMRAKIGETVELVNGKGVLANAYIENIHKKSCELFITSAETKTLEKESLILIQALPLMDRLEYIVEKVIELGVTEIRLVPTQNSKKGTLTETQLKRLKLISISALKQSGRLSLPKIILFPDLYATLPNEGTLLFGDVRPSAKKIFIEHSPITIAIGPESGFTDKEVALLEKSKAKGITLNQNILRTDTAAIAAISIINFLIKS